VRELPRLLPLAAAVAVADVAGPEARIKWPNDVLLDGRKLSGVLVEGRPQEGWAVIGIGLNVAVALDELPDDVRPIAATLGLGRDAIEPMLERLLGALARHLAAPPEQILEAWRARDALLGEPVSWTAGSGVAQGVDGDGRLVVELAAGGRVALDAGEVHLARRG
jgi:BirA family biotin operon repressor/biotin-[acetyl-CoA-carboxylase] ligase